MLGLDAKGLPSVKEYFILIVFTDNDLKKWLCLSYAFSQIQQKFLVAKAGVYSSEFLPNAEHP